MDRRRIVALIVLALVVLIVVSVPVLLFTPVGTVLNPRPPDLNGPSLAPLKFQVLPRRTPQAVLTSLGTPGPLTASEALLMDSDTGTILYDHDGEQAVPMASTTKIMTALIAIQTGKLDQNVTVGADAPSEVILNGGSSADLQEGDVLPLKELLYGLMLPSGDDAAVAIADTVAGSVSNFVRIMNVEAEKLHLYNTHFDNPDGLQPTDNAGNPIFDRHYTTAYDLARLARYAMRLPLFAQIVQTRELDLPANASHPAFKWKNTNELLGTYTGISGIKTGTTPWAGECLVFAAQRKGQILIGVILHSTTDASRFKDARTLLDWGFALPLQIQTFHG